MNDTFLSIDQRDVHHVPELGIIFSLNMHNSVCSLWIWTKYQTLHYLTIIYRHTYYDHALPCVLSVTSLWRQSLFKLWLRCYWQGDQTVAHPSKSLRQGQTWPVQAQTLTLVQNDCLHQCLKSYLNICQVLTILD